MVVDGVQTFTPPLLFEVITLPKTRRFLCGDQVRFPSKELKIEFSVTFCGGEVTAEYVYPTCFAYQIPNYRQHIYILPLIISLLLILYPYNCLIDIFIQTLIANIRFDFAVYPYLYFLHSFLSINIDLSPPIFSADAQFCVLIFANCSSSKKRTICNLTNFSKTLEIILIS